MFTTQLPDDQKKLLVKPEPVELVLSEDGATKLSLVLPPYDDLIAIATLQGRHFSLKEHAEKFWAKFQQAFAEELEALKEKTERFKDSTTFLIHLANLAELVGDREQEYGYLRAAANIDNEPFFRHRIGENLLARGNSRDAEK